MWDTIKSWFRTGEAEHVKRNRRYKLALLKPKNLNRIPVFRASKDGFTAPRTVDLRDYCPPTENQGDTPWCAAYSTAHWLSNIKWRVTDKLPYYDPALIYAKAKQLDGFPDQDGTTLTATLQVVRDEMKQFDPGCEIQTFYGFEGVESIKYAIHKFGCCLLGFLITTEWYDITPDNSTIKGIDADVLGGHAVLACGYNEFGVIIQNSWGEPWGEYGYALVTWDAVRKFLQYGAVMTRALDKLALPA